MSTPESDLSALAAPEAREELAHVLAQWVPRQRWFGGKARDVAGLTVRDTVVLTAADEGEAVFDALVDVTYDDGHRESYQVPLCAGALDADGAVGTVAGVSLVDATFAPAAARVLAALTQQPTQRGTARGDVVFGRPLGDADVVLDQPRRMAAEQSNTSIVLADTAILKLFRRLEAGENPDVEVTRALTEAGFPHAPSQRGAFGIRHGDGSVTVLGVLADFVHGGREGWELATADVAAAVRGGPADAAMPRRVGDLGRAVAQMHATLARTLGSRDAEPADLQVWVEDMHRQAAQVLAAAQRRAPDAAAAVVSRRSEILDRIDRLADEKATGPLTRIHGDLHLGQVLLDAGGRWQLLDFEGEPSKPLAQRRALNAPLRDVAGMVRSFDYAAAAGSGGDLSHVPEAAARWRDESQRLFVQAYADAAAADGILPHDDAVGAQLDAFELDKAVYELGYELANRPDWVPIPVGGITRVLDRSTN